MRGSGFDHLLEDIDKVMWTSLRSPFSDVVILLMMWWDVVCFSSYRKWCYFFNFSVKFVSIYCPICCVGTTHYSPVLYVTAVLSNMNVASSFVYDTYRHTPLTGLVLVDDSISVFHPEIVNFKLLTSELQNFLRHFSIFFTRF